MLTSYGEAPSGVVLQFGETVSVLAVLEDTVFVWPAPVPALMLTRRPSHWSAVHVLVPAWSVLFVCVMTYSDEASGVVAQAGERVSVLAGLEDSGWGWCAPDP